MNNIWQNKEGNEVPNWLQGRGDGEVGKTIIVINNDLTILKILSNEWVFNTDKGLVILPKSR